MDNWKLLNDRLFLPRHALRTTGILGSPRSPFRGQQSAPLLHIPLRMSVIATAVVMMFSTTMLIIATTVVVATVTTVTIVMMFSMTAVACGSPVGTAAVPCDAAGCLSGTRAMLVAFPLAVLLPNTIALAMAVPFMTMAVACMASVAVAVARMAVAVACVAMAVACVAVAMAAQNGKQKQVHDQPHDCQQEHH